MHGSVNGKASAILATFTWGNRRTISLVSCASPIRLRGRATAFGFAGQEEISRTNSDHRGRRRGGGAQEGGLNSANWLGRLAGPDSAIRLLLEPARMWWFQVFAPSPGAWPNLHPGGLRGASSWRLQPQIALPAQP